MLFSDAKPACKPPVTLLHSHKHREPTQLLHIPMTHAEMGHTWQMGPVLELCLVSNSQLKISVSNFRGWKFESEAFVTIWWPLQNCPAKVRRNGIKNLTDTLLKILVLKQGCRAHCGLWGLTQHERSYGNYCNGKAELSFSTFISDCTNITGKKK